MARANSTKTVYDYHNGVEYKNGNLEAIYHAEGRVTKVGSDYSYEYALKDHLGNSRVFFSNRGARVNFIEADDILQESHYYAFGMAYDQYPWGNTTTPNKYQYNGKELNDDFGLNLSDYGARWYDAAIGRWTSVDPLATKYHEWSPYNYVIGNPIKFIDPDGMAVNYPIITITKQKVGSTDQRVLGYPSEEATKIDLYKAVVTDTEDPNFKMEFAVTRDAWAVTERNSDSGTMSNIAFEPKDGNINHYTAKAEYLEYPKKSGSGVPGLKLTQKNSEEMYAEPRKASVELGYRTKADVAKGVMLHVGGYYKTKKGITLAASEGCFGICNSKNSSSNPSNKEAAFVLRRIIQQAEKSKSNSGKIELIIQKRDKIPDNK